MNRRAAAASAHGDPSSRGPDATLSWQAGSLRHHRMAANDRYLASESYVPTHSTTTPGDGLHWRGVTGRQTSCPFLGLVPGYGARVCVRPARVDFLALDPSPLRRNGSYHCVRLSYMSPVCAWRPPRTGPSTCAAYWSRTVDIHQAPNDVFVGHSSLKQVACPRYS